MKKAMLSLELLVKIMYVLSEHFKNMLLRMLLTNHSAAQPPTISTVTLSSNRKDVTIARRVSTTRYRRTRPLAATRLGATYLHFPIGSAAIRYGDRLTVGYHSPLVYVHCLHTTLVLKHINISHPKT